MSVMPTWRQTEGTEAIDTDTPTGRAMWQMIGLLAELDRSLISERTRAGDVHDAPVFHKW